MHDWFALRITEKGVTYTDFEGPLHSCNLRMESLKRHPGWADVENYEITEI